MKLSSYLIFISCSIFSFKVFAFQNNTISAGLGYLSENILYETSQKPSGKSGFLGETSFPLLMKWDVGFGSDWFLAPQLVYSLIPRSAKGQVAKVEMTRFDLLFGQNYESTGLDWYFGPGYLQRIYDGKGGATDLPNGTGTATFYKPGRNSTSRKLTILAGGSFTFFSMRVGLDLVFENLFSSVKRSESIMLSYTYSFSGDFILNMFTF